ncbi:MAG: GrpB family protein [Pseudohongiellaceae bacterium]
MTIELKEYQADWSKMFHREKELILKEVGAWLNGSVEHVGSTAVPGMLAKPTIDIMFGVRSLKHAEPAIDILQRIDYCYYPYKSDVMHWFCKPSPELRTFHLHLVPYKSDLWQERIRFREILIGQPEIALRYAKLKRTLVEEEPTDRDAYTRKKWLFIKKVLRDERC